MVHARYGADMMSETMRVPYSEKRAYRYRKDGTVSKYVRSRAITKAPRRRVNNKLEYKYDQVGRD